MIAIVIEFLRPYLWRLIVTGIVIAALVCGWLTLKIHYEKIGYANAIAAVAAKDKGALDAVRDVESKVDDCYRANRNWDVVSGVCQ